MRQLSQSVTLRRYRAQRWETVAAEAVVEAPVSLTVNGVHWVTFICTPAELDALAVGFLFNEGIIGAPADIADVQVRANGANVDVWLIHAVSRPPIWRRTSGSTGGMIRNEPKSPCQLSKMLNGSLLPARAVGELMAALQGAPQLYHIACGVHASALSNGQAIGLLAADIGRHNTLDKLAGRCLLDRRVMSASILLTTGRFSSVMVEKAARREAPILISRTAPSTLAIELADRYGLTLIGCNFSVYTHGWRLADWPRQGEDEETANAELLQPATTCAYCGVGCQFDLNVKDGRVIRVTANPRAPANGDHLYVKGRYGYDFVHHADRLTQPKVRRYLLEGDGQRPARADRGEWVAS